VCFVAGTLVAAAVGHVAIEEIKAGDLVYAENPETGEKGLKRVVRTFVNEAYELIHIKVGGQEITTTPEHPFWVPQQGWTDAVELRAGDILLLLNGELVVVEQVQHEILESPVTVYNFEVEDFHTYYVSEISVLVHNTCKQARLRELADDPKVASHLRAEIKQSKIHNKHGNYKVPRGYELRHRPGFERFKGYDYGYTDLQLKPMHAVQTRLQHKLGLFKKK